MAVPHRSRAHTGPMPTLRLGVPGPTSVPRTPAGSMTAPVPEHDPLCPYRPGVMWADCLCPLFERVAEREAERYLTADRVADLRAQVQARRAIAVADLAESEGQGVWWSFKGQTVAYDHVLALLDMSSEGPLTSQGEPEVSGGLT